jgi:hypothetical protein
MWGNLHNQQVGLEEATLKRKSNSSLVKSSCAVNITGLSVSPKLRALTSGRGAFLLRRSRLVMVGGAAGSANADMSSD